MKAENVFHGSDGSVTTEYYKQLNAKGIWGKVAVALFRAQKTSTRAKMYRGRKWRDKAYDIKSWSINQVAELLMNQTEITIKFGWKEDPDTEFMGRPSWVFYCEIPTGQVSFHSPSRGKGPNYDGEWDREHKSQERILEFCNNIFNQ